MPERKNKQADKRRKQLIAAILGAVPLIGLLWGIWTFFEGKRSAKDDDTAKRQELIETSYVRLESAAILDFINGKSTVTAKTAPQYRKTGLMKDLFDSFTPAAIAARGQTIVGATFLLITNRGKTSIQRMEVHNDEPEPNFGSLQPDTTLLVCVRLEKTDHTARLQPVKRLHCVTPVTSFPFAIDPIPDPAIMKTFGVAGVTSFMYPARIENQSPKR